MLMIRPLWIIVVLQLAIQIVTSFNKTSSEWTTIAQQTIYQASQNFDAATTALGSFNSSKHAALVKLSQHTAKLAGVLGVFSAIFSLVMTFLPTEESAELKYMKSEFGKLSGKVDTIARSLDDTKNLIELAANKALYASYEHKIHYEFLQMEKCIKQLEKVRCSDERSCRQKKQLVAQNYVRAMNVHESIYAIFRGVTTDTTFGTAMLSLLKRKSKCNIPKINLFANKIIALMTKGFTVSIFHKMLTITDHNVLDDTVQANEMFRSVERKRQDIEESCFKNMDYWMSLDVQNSYDIFSSDIQITNTKVINLLKLKYPWIHWGVLTYKGKDKPAVGPDNGQFRQFQSTSKEHEIHSFVIPIIHAEVENLEDKIQRWKSVAKAVSSTDDLKKQLTKIGKGIKENAALENKVQTYAIFKGTKWIFGQYNSKIKQQILGISEVSSQNVFVHRPNDKKWTVALVSLNSENYPPKCSKTCNLKGTCYLLPYSMQFGCTCNSGYSGEGCQSSDTNLNLKSSINSLLQNTMQLPTFASIQHSIEDTRLYLKSSTENIQESISKLGKKIEENIKTLGEFMSNKFDWFHLLLKYKNSIENLHYFHDISNEKSDNPVCLSKKKNTNASKRSRNSCKDRFSFFQEKDIAAYLLSPTGIQKWLYQLNFLIVGRRDSELNSHKPLILMVMEKYKYKLCSTQYKNEITKTYRQLMLLQLQGFMLWSNAYNTVNRESSVIADRYATVLKDQQKYFKDATCSAKIPNSKNFNRGVNQKVNFLWSRPK